MTLHLLPFPHVFFRNRKKGFYTNHDLNKQEVGFIFEWSGSGLWSLFKYSKVNLKNQKHIGVNVLFKSYPMSTFMQIQSGRTVPFISSPCSSVLRNKQGYGSRPGSMMQSLQIQMHHITQTKNFISSSHTTLHNISSSPFRTTSEHWGERDISEPVLWFFLLQLPSSDYSSG